MDWVFLHEPEDGFEEMTLSPYEPAQKIQKLKKYAYFLLKLAISKIH